MASCTIKGRFLEYSNMECKIEPGTGSKLTHTYDNANTAVVV